MAAHRRHPAAPCQASQTRTFRTPRGETTGLVEAVCRNHKNDAWVVSYRPHRGQGLGNLQQVYIHDRAPTTVVI